MKTSYRVASRFLYLRLAMSLEEAKQVLGFPPSANPSESEISKAYKQKALEHHPDRGGDLSKMVEVNKAKDLLTGKDKPSFSDDWDRSDGPSYRPEPRPRPDPVRVSFEDAKSKAGVPTGVEWKFRTTTGYSGHGDHSVSASVVVGALGDKWVFVAMEHFTRANAFTGEDEDVWWMSTQVRSGALRDVAPKVIRDLWDTFPNTTKGYNAKVELLAEGTPLSSKLLLSQGRAMAFKDALDILGAISDDDPWKGRKLQITMVLNSKGLEDSGKSIDVIVNGREFKLRPESVEFLDKKSKFLRVVFGTYYYWMGDKKVLTKVKDAKKVLEYLAEKLTAEPQALRDALMAAAAQSK